MPVITVALVLATSTANAAFEVYSDRAAWQAAAGGVGDLFEDFDSRTVDTYYGAGTPVTVGFLTLEVVGGASDGSWIIDAPPVPQVWSIPDINGTAYATTLGIADNPTYGDTRMTFAPVRALGFDYSGAAYSTVDGRLFTDVLDVVEIPELEHGELAFIGLLYTGGETFTSLDWGAGPLKTVYRDFGMGIDNIEAFSPVPLPAAVWQFGTAMALLGSRRAGIRRRGRRRCGPDPAPVARAA